MLRIRVLIALVSLVVTLPAPVGSTAIAQTPVPVVKTVEVTPPKAEAEVGQQVKFSAIAKDESGKQLDLKPTVWFAAPFDVGAADMIGTVSTFSPGELRVGVMIGGKVGYATITVKPARVTRIEIDTPAGGLVVGGAIRLNATARTANGDPRNEAPLVWASDNPSIATVDAAGVATGIKPGRAVLRATSEGTSGNLTVNVLANPIQTLAIEPKSVNARTGDVVRFTIKARNAAGAAVKEAPVRWAVSGEGAMIESDGGFVAERPGTYVVTAAGGSQTAIASVVVTPRNVERDIEVIGRAKVKDVQTAEQWIFGNYAYVSSISDSLFVYDISNPAEPKLTDTVKLDCRILNDVSTTADGRITVMSREGSSNRKNGIVFLDSSEPAHPKVISEYTATVSGGVHSAFVDGHYVYLTDDATGSMRVIDFADVKSPKEVARWEVKSLTAKVHRTPMGESVGGRYLHDVQVKDGLAYLAYWRDGLVILDVGAGIRGGSPEKPVFVSQYRFNHNELYGDGWLAGAHAVFRYKNYVFVGDEVFPGEFDISSRQRIPVRGITHVIDVSDIMNPRKVAEYPVPEAGAHNIWVKDDVMYMGYYSGGGRVVDVSGELRGDLYREGREIARVWTGDPDGFRPNQPFAWGAQPQGDKIFFIDINSGLWIVKLGKLKDKGLTTSPGN
jgi:plastocyanin